MSDQDDAILSGKLKDLTTNELRILNKEGYVMSESHGMIGDPAGLALNELFRRLDEGEVL